MIKGAVNQDVPSIVDRIVSEVLAGLRESLWPCDKRWSTDGRPLRARIPIQARL